MRAASSYELDQAQGNSEAFVEGLEIGMNAVKSYASSNGLNIFNFRKFVFPREVDDSIGIEDNIRLSDQPDGPNGLKPVYALRPGWKTGVVYQAQLETGEKIDV